MAVALLIGLWTMDKLTFDSVHTHRERLGQVWQFVNFTGEKASYGVTPQPLADTQVVARFTALHIGSKEWDKTMF